MAYVRACHLQLRGSVPAEKTPKKRGSCVESLVPSSKDPNEALNIYGYFFRMKALLLTCPELQQPIALIKRNPVTPKTDPQLILKPSRSIWVLPKILGTSWVLAVRSIIFWGLYWSHVLRKMTVHSPGNPLTC